MLSGHRSVSATEHALSSWLAEFASDEEAVATTWRLLGEAFVFYVLVAVGFGMLWLLQRSSTRIHQLRAAAGRLAKEQLGKKFEPPDVAKMYGMY